MFSKGALRSGGIAFCVTMLLLVLLAGFVTVFYNTASVIHGKDEVVSVQKSNNQYSITWLSRQKTVPVSEVEEAVSSAMCFSPCLPSGARAVYLASSGLWSGTKEAVWWFLDVRNN